MSSKILTDKLADFVASVNKKNKKHNGKRITYAFTNRKRKG